LNLNPPDLSLPSNWDHRCEPWVYNAVFIWHTEP
jgi:hypothetical protein